MDITDHWVGHSLIKIIIRLQCFFLGKRIIEDLGYNLIGAPIDASNNENLAVAEEANADEAITSVDKLINDIEIDLEE